MAKHSQKFHFYLKYGQDVTTPVHICLVAIINKKRLKIYTGEKISARMWSSKLERCIVTNSQSDNQNKETKRINRYLDWLEHTSIAIYKKDFSFLNFTEEHDIAAEFKQKLTAAIQEKKGIEQEEIQKSKIIPSAFFAQYIASMATKRNTSTRVFLDPGTITHHKVVLKRYLDFITEKKKNDEFTLFNEKFEDDFELWGFEREYSPNTVVASFSIMKVWLNEAEKQGLITNKAFHSYKSKSSNSDHIYLTEAEIDSIYRLDFKDRRIKKQIDPKSQIEITRDLFVLSCWTGLRFTDLKNLNAAVWDKRNKQVTIVTHKTKVKVVIPLHQWVINIYEKYKGNFPQPNDKSHSIKHLKKIGELAGIDSEVLVKENRGGKITTKKVKKYELIKNHTGRRSFATNLYKKKMPTIAIMKMTGHTTEENFMKYIKISLEENAELNRQYFESHPPKSNVAKPITLKSTPIHF